MPRATHAVPTLVVRQDEDDVRPLVPARPAAGDRRHAGRRHRAFQERSAGNHSYGKIARPSMRFGVNILNFGPGANPNALKHWAQVAEAVGYDFAMISDHVAITPDVAAQYPEPFYDPFV